MNVLVSRGMIRDVITALQYSEEAYLADKNTGVVSEVGNIVNSLRSRVEMTSRTHTVHSLVIENCYDILFWVNKILDISFQNIFILCGKFTRW